MNRKVFIGLMVFAAFLVFWGCSEVSQPEVDSQYLYASQSFTMIENDIEFMERGGMPLSDSKAVFSIGWRELMDPSGGTSEVAGHASAVAFEEATASRPHPFGGGIDMGTVYLNYNSNQLEMHKMVGREGGIVYILSHRMPGSTGPELGFVPNTVYEFETTGPSVFDPVQLGITSPPALLELTSHTAGQAISASEDLTLTWSGGKANTGVVLHVHPALNNDPGQRPGPGFGPRPPHGGRPPHGQPFPPAPLSPNALIVVLNDNPGTYTFSSQNIQELINTSGASEIVCGVSQLDVNEVSPNGEVLRVIMHNRDGVRLVVQ
jgi:hypothetical protein